jgi:hypothetical protein
MMRRFTITYRDRNSRTMELDTCIIEGCQFSDGSVAYTRVGHNSHGSGGTFAELLRRHSLHEHSEPVVTWLDPEPEATP